LPRRSYHCSLVRYLRSRNTRLGVPVGRLARHVLAALEDQDASCRSAPAAGPAVPPPAPEPTTITSKCVLIPAWSQDDTWPIRRRSGRGPAARAGSSSARAPPCCASRAPGPAFRPHWRGMAASANLFGGLPEPAVLGLHDLVQPALHGELGLGEARADGGDLDPLGPYSASSAWLKLDQQALGAGIEAVAGDARRKGRQRGHVDDRAATAAHHAGDDRIGERARASHHGHQEVPLPRPGHACEALGDAEAGIVDQHVDSRPLSARAAITGAWGLEHRQVGRNDQGLDAVRGGQFSRQARSRSARRATRATSRAASRIGAREGLAEAGRCAGDQGQPARDAAAFVSLDGGSAMTDTVLKSFRDNA